MTRIPLMWSFYVVIATKKPIKNLKDQIFTPTGVEELEASQSGLIVLPPGYPMPYSLSDDEIETKVSKYTPNARSHLFKDPYHKRSLVNAGIRDENLEDVIRKSYHKIKESGFTYIEFDDRKIVYICVVPLDQVVSSEEDVPDLDSPFASIVFGHYYFVPQNPAAREFPKTLQQQHNRATKRLESLRALKPADYKYLWTRVLLTIEKR